MSDTEQRSRGVLEGISNEMVRLYKEQFGRGPTRVRTYWDSPDLITVVLEDTLTPAERKLLELQEDQRVRDIRMFFQYARIEDFCEAVERLTGRTVRSFVSGLDAEVEGLAIESFILHPEGSDAPSRRRLVRA
jgi:uncharacterized protein YbcI